jgi:hypothetical protein
MFKKIVISTLVIILLGAVIVGAYDIYNGSSSLEMPEVSLAANAAGGGGNGGWGQGNGQDQGRGQGIMSDQGYGQGMGSGQSQAQMTQHQWTTLQGTVASVDAQNMVVDTAEQGQLTLELGPAGFADQQGVAFAPGDEITVQGFDESGMFHAVEITQATTGQSLQLRDPNGRPLWAGQGQGGQGQGDGSGVPQAMVDKEWITLNGTVNTQARQGLVVDTAEMGQLTLQMGPPWFSGDQGVAFNPGDAVTIIGFTGEGSTFQAGEITNETTGQKFLLRDPNGRPLWAGRGGQGGGGGGQGQGGRGQGQGGGF